MQRNHRLSLVLVLFTTWAHGCSRDASPPAPTTRESAAPATFVGRTVCAECHADQVAGWRGSHHDLATQEASARTVLGDFDEATFELGVTSTFSRRDDGFFVRTDGPDGELRDYRVAYTFGVEPLQQYLVDPGGAPGALHALQVAWDTRPETEGGQRWFHLYDEPVTHDDPLHWTGPLQNWNTMCADCHSTGLVRGYNAAAGSFETTWEEIDVSCEACHGPASRHVDAARAGAGDGSGLLVDLKRPGRWTFVEGSAIAQLAGATAGSGSAQVDACGRCHARRSPVAPYEHGGDLHDAYSVALLEAPLYHADGQILDEVYVYGSFLQSKMHAAGVVCSDCHEPHGTRLWVEGNALCSTCHRGDVYDVPEHHHHAVGTPGSACVDCHMPAREYMVVDPRRDHSFRVPRPDLSSSLRTPNACTGCHEDRDDAWAAEEVASWGAEPGFHYGEAFSSARTWQADAEDLLLRVIDDGSQPAIVRASALAALTGYLSPASLPAVEKALRDSHPLVRGGALRALESAEAATRLRLGGPLVDDPVRTVRLQAARLLAGAPSGAATLGLFAVVDEYRDSLQWLDDRPDSHLHLGDLEVRLGDAEAAGAAYRKALEMSPSLGVAAVNLADVYRATGRDADGDELLRSALAREPGDAGLHQALGLTLVRLERPAEALESLRKSYELAPGEPRYAYVYGVALVDFGRVEEGLRVLEEAHRRFPGERALAAGYRALGG